MDKPSDVFDRDWEWGELVRFARDARPELTLGVVSGRRRQGKSLLLQAIAEATGGFYYEAIEGTSAEILQDFASKLALHLRAPAPLALADSEAALSAAIALGQNGSPTVVVIDEFPYWVRADPTLPSRLRNLLGARARSGSQTRLLLCGSAIGLMGELLGGQAPLRGRAGLELVVRSFDYRTARDFWGIDDLELAVKVYAVVGGTPAYRRELAADDTPRGPRDFDSWVARTVLNPAVPLFREARYLLAEDPAIGDLSLYQSVLAAIASGETSSARIAARLGRPATALGHPLAVLADAGYVTREVDAFHEKRVHYAITEPLITFHHAILRPRWAELERPGRAREIWRSAQPTFVAKVLGPTFEELARQWAREHADEHLGERAERVCRGLIPDAEEKTTLEVDVVALGRKREVLLLGEAKWGKRMDVAHLAPLTRARELLAQRKFDVSRARLACFSGGGFTKALESLAQRENVLLVDLETLYRAP